MEVQCGSRHGSGYFYISPKDNSITSGPNATVCIDGRADSGSLSGDNANTGTNPGVCSKNTGCFLSANGSRPLATAKSYVNDYDYLWLHRQDHTEIMGGLDDINLLVGGTHSDDFQNVRDVFHYTCI